MNTVLKHLNYSRLSVGMLLLGAAFSIYLKDGKTASAFVLIALLNTSIGYSRNAPASHGSSPLQKEMDSLAMRLAQGTAILAFVLILVGANASLGMHNTILLGVSIVAAMIPSGLATEVSIIVTHAAGRLTKHRRPVQKLSAVETLGGTEFILTETTGGLTANKSIVKELLVGRDRYKVTDADYTTGGAITTHTGKSLSAETLRNLELFFVTASFAGRENALVTLARNAGIDTNQQAASQPEIKEFPIDPVRQLLSSVRKRGNQIVVFTRGTPESVLGRSTEIWDHGHIRKLTGKDRAFFENYNQRQARAGRQGLALGFRILPKKATRKKFSAEEIEQDLTFLGMVSMADPLRTAVPAAMKTARKAHIKVSLFSDDFPLAAKAVARQAHLGDNLTVVSKEELSGLSNGRILQLVKHGGTVFSRVAPEDKLRIVELIRRDGQAVVTGGIQDGLDTLVGAIEQGRLTLHNITNALRCALTGTAAEIGTVLISLAALSAFHVAPAVTAIQILAINVVAQILPLAALGWDTAQHNLMRDKPHSLRSRIISRQAAAGLAGFGFVAALLAYGNYLFFFVRHQLSPQHIDASLPLYHQATTLTCVTLVLCLFVYLMFERSDRHEKFFTNYLWGNKKLLAAFALSFLLIGSIVYSPILQAYFSTAPLDAADWLTALLCGGLYGTFRLLQRHTRLHSRHAVIKLHREVHAA